MIRPYQPTDTAACATVYNHYIRHTVVSFEEVEITEAEMARRAGKVQPDFPWLVWETAGQVLGYAYGAPWNERAAYRYAAESTIYLHPEATGQGIGTQLYQALLDQLQTQGITTVIGGIALPNAGSVALHEKLGFEKVAHYARVGYKFGRWIDVGYWQRFFA